MGLVGRCLSGAHLAQGHHHLNGVEMFDDLQNFGGCEAAEDFDDLFPGYIDIEDLPGDLQGIHLHGPLGLFEVKAMVDDKVVDDVKVFPFLPIHFLDDPLFDDETRLGIERTLHIDQPHLRPLMDKRVFVDLSLG